MTDDDETFDAVDEYDGLSEVDELDEAEAALDEPAEAVDVLDVLDVVDAGTESVGAEDDDPQIADGDLGGDGGLDDELANAIDGEIHELAAERDQFKDIAVRLQADFDNYRKRMSAQIAGEVDRATGKLAEALLPVLDAAEAAYVQHPDEVGPLLNLMLAELRKHGLESIDLLDKPFDPNLADAVAHEPDEGGEPVVAEVLRSGYSWNGRTLRPAMVRTRD